MKQLRFEGNMFYTIDLKRYEQQEGENNADRMLRLLRNRKKYADEKKAYADWIAERRIVCHIKGDKLLFEREDDLLLFKLTFQL